MNTGPTHQPLDEEEAGLARRLRALPGGQPAAELDARILAQAHAAVAAGRRPVRPWLWGVSSAAVAVLAVGLFWRAGLPPDGSGPAAEAPPALAPDRQQEETAAELRFEQPPADAAGARKASAEAAPDQAPAPPADARERAPAPAPAAAPAPATQQPSTRQAARLPTRTEAAALADGSTLQESIRAHARGPASEWLAHIGTLQQQGQLDAARAHLRAFRQAHPRHAIPQALQALLDEDR